MASLLAGVGQLSQLAKLWDVSTSEHDFTGKGWLCFVWWYRNQQYYAPALVKQPSVDGPSPVYEEVELDKGKNEMYEHPGIKHASAASNLYQDLESMYTHQPW